MAPPAAVADRWGKLRRTVPMMKAIPAHGRLASSDGPQDRGVLTRTVELQGPNVGAANNVIITSKYTALSFCPVVLYELLHPMKRFANFYFLIVGFMQMVPAITLTNGTPSTWMVLIFLVLVDAFFMGREDLSRHRADAVQNSTEVELLSADGDDFEKRAWADVKAGDVVRVRSRESFPADLLLLRACDPAPGQCWVNTKPLDGESDTKLRLAPKVLPALLDEAVQGDAVDVAALRRVLTGEVWCEEPNDKVNDFMGQLRLVGREPQLISEMNMLLRGCQLRNTAWVLGLVVASGVETKINFGGGGADAPKTGSLAKRVNKDIFGVVVWLVVVCVIGGTLFVLGGDESFWYLADHEVRPDYSFSGWLQMTFRFFLLEYQFVPVSLYVSMNVVYISVKFFVLNDVGLYDESQDEPCQVRQMSLLDELGQVTHIFSDKTGTLTSNHMEFRRAWIDGTVYGVGDTAISRAVKGDGAAVEVRTAPVPAFAGCRPASATFVNYEEDAAAPSLFEPLARSGAADAEAAARIEFMVNLAVNHSVLLEVVNGREELCASSPDEQAFVAGAEYFGFEMVSRDSERSTITIRDKRFNVEHVVELLVAFPYESSRKRMSVIVRLPPALLAECGGGEAVRIYSKGADSVMLTLLREGSKGTDPESRATLDALLYEWADIALRTLVFAKREVMGFDAWLARWTAASEDPEAVRKQKLGEPNAITDLQLELEADLILQAATAIEDKLQDGVPEVLADLRAAGIKVWMLTGDKVGTAKNIATACNILPSTGRVSLLEITTETHAVLNEVRTSDLLEAQLRLGRCEERRQLVATRRWGGRKARREAARFYAEELQAQIERLDAKHPALSTVRADLRQQWDAMVATEKRAGAVSEPLSFCLVLDEKAIEYCGTMCKQMLAAVGNGSHSVVACRARKDQKAQMLKLIKDSVKKSVCLAIGDGANDVAMIKVGHIGVGIIGKEGMQAVNNSDFAIGQFRFLRQLLLVHGRYCYRRMAVFCY